MESSGRPYIGADVSDVDVGEPGTPADGTAHETTNATAGGGGSNTGQDGMGLIIKGSVAVELFMPR